MTTQHEFIREVELASDSNGRDAAFITVVLDDDLSGEPYPWTRLKPIHDSMHIDPGKRVCGVLFLPRTSR